MDKGEAIERFRAALKAAVAEVREDPELAGKMVSAICTELGLDGLASVYLADRLKKLISGKTRKAHHVP